MIKGKQATRNSGSDTCVMASMKTDAAEGVGAIKRNNNNNNNRSADDLYIRSDPELQDFWRAILPAFVRIVDPRESGLMDQLFAEDMLSESDVESLCGKNVVTRRDQARKLAVSLMKYGWNEFMTMVAPALCDAKYTHIIPCKYWIANDEQRTEMTSLRSTGMTTTELCLRHIIKHRLRPATLADMLFHHHYLSLAEYRMFISEEARSNSEKWTKIFSILSKPPSPQAAKEIENDLRQRLSRQTDLPDSLSDILLRGLPCCCKERSHENKDLLEKLQKRISEGISPCSTWSRSDGESVSSYSPSSTLRDVSDICSDCDDRTLVSAKDLHTSKPSHVQQLLTPSQHHCLQNVLEGAAAKAVDAVPATVPRVPLVQQLTVSSWDCTHVETCRLPYFNGSLEENDTGMTEIQTGNHIRPFMERKVHNTEEEFKRENDTGITTTQNFGNQLDLRGSAAVSYNSSPVTVTYISLPAIGCSDTDLDGLSSTGTNRLQNTSTAVSLGNNVGPLHENPTGFFCTNSSNQPQITSTAINSNIVVQVHGGPTGLSSGIPPNQSHVTSIDFLRGNTVTPLHRSACAISSATRQQITSTFNGIVSSMHNNPDDMSRGELPDLQNVQDSFSKLFLYLQWRKRKCFIAIICVIAIIIQLLTATVHFVFLFGNLTESVKITFAVFGAIGILCQPLTLFTFFVLIIANLQFQNTCVHPTFGHSVHNRHNVSQSQPDGTLMNETTTNP